LEAGDSHLVQKTLMKKLKTPQTTTSTASWMLKGVNKELLVSLESRVTILYMVILNVLF